MSGQATTQIDTAAEPMEVDPWEQAFAAIEREASGDLSTAPGGDNGQDGADAAVDSGHQDASDANTANTGAAEGNNLGPDGYDNSSDGSFGETEDTPQAEHMDIEAYEKEIRGSIESRAIEEMAKAYIQKGFRHTGDKLGANINQEDILKRDSDGRVHYYNPDTGREFTGDDPGAQAQAWCDRYNKQLADSFNDSCTKYIDHLMEEQKPTIEMLKFEATYDNLDPIRQSMLDNLLEDYEIVKDGEVIGYSCDLNKALAAVNRQVRTIQEKYRMSHTTTSEEKPKASSPALDIKSSAKDATKSNKKPEFKNIAEAMEWEQDQMLAKLKEKDAARGH